MEVSREKDPVRLVLFAILVLIGKAVQFLTDTHRDGRKLIRDVEADAVACGIKLRTLRRAREAMKIIASKDDFTADWYWELPLAATTKKAAA